MQSKTVRRRRAALILLVGLSLGLLTAYFGESQTGVLHTVQRGVLEVFSPIQRGANRALKPARDLIGWVGDTTRAKGEAKRLRTERDRLLKESIAADAAMRENRELRSLLELDRSGGIDSYSPLTARVIGRSPTVWYATINIDHGSNSGVRSGQPVVSGNGLVGRISAVTANVAQVTLLSDASSAVSAKLNQTGEVGTVRPTVGNPNDLVLDFLSGKTTPKRGQAIVTAGSKSSRLESLFPPNIPIGKVTSVSEEEIDVYRRVHVEPYTDLRRFDFVQVLRTDPDGGRIGVDSE